MTVQRRDLFEDVAAETEPHMGGDPVHDMHHAWRVCNLGTRIARAEGADVEIVGAAAITHDLHRVVSEDAVEQSSTSPRSQAREDGEFVHPRETVPTVERILDAAGFPAEKISEVCHCVAVHEEYDFEPDPDPAETIEAEVLRDADNLDAIGAVGIARTFAYGGAHGNPLWRPERADEPVGAYEHKSGDDGASTIRHVREKLLRLRETMHTETGRELAEERHEYLEEFVERFRREWTGEL